MAKKRKYNTKKDPLDYISLPKIDLDPETKRGIFIVLLLAIGAISFLSLFNLAGAVGFYLNKGIVFAFGWGKWLGPLAVFALAFLLYNKDKYFVRKSVYVGLFLFIISMETIFHFFIAQADWESAVFDGRGGGYFGFLFINIFVKLIGFWGGIIAVIGLLLISIMSMFNAPLYRLLGSESWLAKLIFHPIKFIFKRENTEEGYAGEEEVIGEEIEDGEISIEDEEGEEAPGIIFSKHQVNEETEDAVLPASEKDNEDESKIWKRSNIKIDLPLELLSGQIGKPTSGDIKNNTLVIEKSLENFGIKVEMGEVNVGPTVTQYTFKPSDGVKLSRITNLGNDLALALAAHPIRIEAPIPGKSLVGVEVPNQAKAIVGLREILSDKDFKGRKTNLTLALGKDVSGKAWMYDLAKMPHLLVAGATNSGKSVCLNSIIVSLLYQNNPDDLKFIMVDPKRVELPVYNGIPHLLVPVITDVGKTINALKYCLNEMDRRFELLAKFGRRNIADYNSSSKGKENKMPYLVFVVDELADLMVTAARDIEPLVIRLAQMARAVGIHLVLATQRPSVDVITGLIKANMPARIAFSVASGIDSRTILDSLGAEKLLGRGDMLFVTAELSKPKRLQGAFVSDNEIRKITNYIKERSGPPQYIEEVTERQKVRGLVGVGIDGGGYDDDELLEEAKDLVLSTGKASTSFFQRRLKLGFSRAARLLDILEAKGIVGPGNGSKPREILINKDEYDNMKIQGTSGTNLHNRAESKAPEKYLEDEKEEDWGPPPVFKKEASADKNSENTHSSNKKIEKEEAEEDEIFTEEENEGEEDKNREPGFDDEEGKFFSK